METRADKKQLRSFGLTVGGIFAVIGAWPIIFGDTEPRWWSLALAGLLMLPALIAPGSLAWVYKRWMALGHMMGWINTRIILGAVFYLVVTPIGIIRRWLGKDPMGRQIHGELTTYRIPRKPRPSSHLNRQF